MSGKAAKIMLTEKQESILRRIRRSTTTPQRLVQQVSIILLAQHQDDPDAAGPTCANRV